MAKRSATCALLPCILTLQLGIARAQPTILEPADVADFVSVKKLSFEGNRVSGVVVNHKPHPIPYATCAC